MCTGAYRRALTAFCLTSRCSCAIHAMARVSTSLSCRTASCDEGFFGDLEPLLGRAAALGEGDVDVNTLSLPTSQSSARPFVGLGAPVGHRHASGSVSGVGVLTTHSVLHSHHVHACMPRLLHAAALVRARRP